MNAAANALQTALMLRGVISHFPPDDRAKVDEAEKRIRAVISDMGEHAELVVGLLAAEIVTNQEAAERGIALPFPSHQRATPPQTG